MAMPPLVMYQSVADYQRHYVSNYCREKIFTFDGIRVQFLQQKFSHAFYESTTKGVKDKFSDTRAQRIDWIRAALESPTSELFIGWNKKDKVHTASRRVCVVSEEDYVVIIEIDKKQALLKAMPTKASFITAYVADNSIKDIKASPKWGWT